MSHLTTKAGRWLFALPFIVFGIFHFMNASAMEGLVPGLFPGGVFWVYLAGIAFLAASVSFIIEKRVRLAGQLLAALLLIFVLTIHLPAVIDGDQNAMTQLLKDMALAGGALLLAGHYPEERTAETA
ncbi:MAG: hypothetical protein WEA56_11190 [Balneolaceae bacterium]